MSGFTQNSSPSVLSETNLTVAAFQNFITNFQANTEIVDTVKKPALETYQTAVKLAGERDAFLAALADHQKAIASASNVVQAVKADLALERANGTNAVDTTLGSRETESLISQVEADLRSKRESLTKLQAEPKRRAVRKEEVPKMVSNAKTKDEEIALALKAKAPEEQAPEVTRANRLLLFMRRDFRRSERESLEAELRAYDATEEQLSIQTDLESLRVSRLNKHLTALRGQFSKAKEAESKAAARAAEAELNSRLLRAYRPLNELAQGNLVLATNQLSINTNLMQAGLDLVAEEKELETLNGSFRTLVERVRANETAGVRISDSVGKLLRRHRTELARKTGLNQRVRQRLGQINDAQLAELERNEEKSSLVDLEGSVDRIMQEILAERPTITADEKERVIGKARDLLTKRRDLLKELVDTYQSLNEKLIKLNQTEIKLDKGVAAFANYVEERVLWVRSTDNLGFSGLSGELSAIGALLHPANWQAPLKAATQSFSESPVINGLWLIAIILVFFFQPRARKALRTLAEDAQEREQVSLIPTLRSVAWTLLLAVPGPLIMWLCGDLLAQANSSNQFIIGLAKGLPAGALVYFTLGLYRHVARVQGLGGGHFGWPEADIKLIRRHFLWFMPPAIALVAIIAFVETQAIEGSPARLSLIVLAVLVSVLAFLLLHPSRGIAYTTVGGLAHEGRRRLRFVLGLLAPLVLAVVSVRGYHFTAVEFGWRLMNSAWLIVGVGLVGAVIVRWFYLERKQIALEKLRKKREAAAADPEAAKAIALEIPDVSVTEVKEQTQSLLRTVVLISVLGGLWFIWSDVLPALNVFEKRTLWHVEATAAEVAADESTSAVSGLPSILGKAAESSEEGTAGSGTTTKPKTILKPITLADLLLAMIIVLLTIIASRNLPGFLEISLLKHLRLEAGGGYAVTTLVQYAVALVGIIAAFAAIGITWQKVQWLAAAVTLGIGFGLQEIFANFVAGIILLFERPVRVGDVITVGDTTGTVAKIRIRATTIVNWERQERIIPNKELVTGQLTNWTLSDKINRVVITVGIAYGSDTRLARTILKEILAASQYVMADPRPRVTFDQFGESSLNFTIRAYISNMDDRLNAIHSLHTEIDDRFREANIEISFPQRDLHVRSLPDSWPNPTPPAASPRSEA